MIAGVAFCPHPPALIPAVAAGAADDLADVRAACDEAVQRLAADVSTAVLLGGGSTTRRWPAPTSGDVSGFGVSRSPADAATPPAETPLPLALTVGRWLVDRCPELAVRTLVSVGSADPAAAAAELSRAIGAERVGLLVMGDGSARHGKNAPGYDDPRAAGYDGYVRAALAGGDAAALAGLDGTLAAALLSAGGPPWRAAGIGLGGQTGDHAWLANLLYSAAPFGVAYHVAYWRRP